MKEILSTEWDQFSFLTEGIKMLRDFLKIIILNQLNCYMWPTVSGDLPKDVYLVDDVN